jgi:hypothetical protein
MPVPSKSQDREITLNTKQKQSTNSFRVYPLNDRRSQRDSDDDPYSRILRPLYFPSKEDCTRTPETYPLEGESEDIEARLSYLGLWRDFAAQAKQGKLEVGLL